MVVNTKALHFYNSLKENLKLNHIIEDLFASMANKHLLSGRKRNALSVLESLNSIINSNTNKFNLPIILKMLVIEDLGYDFCALCSKNTGLKSFDITLITPDRKTINYLIPFEAAQKDFFVVFKINKILKTKKDAAKLLNYPLDQKAKNILLAPISLGNKVNSFICVGAKKERKDFEPILKLLSQQLGLILANNELSNQLKQSLCIDPYTSLLTHNHFQQVLNSEISKSKELKVPVSLMLIDLSINNDETDAPGQTVEDDAIFYISNVLKDNIKKIGIGARISRSKMAVIFNNMGVYQTQLVAKRFTEEVSRLDVPLLKDVAVNIGISTIPSNSKDKEELLFNADKTLTLAKEKCKIYKQPSILNCNYIQYLDKKSKREAFILSHNAEGFKNNKLADDLLNYLNQANTDRYNSSIMIEIITSLAAAIDAKDSYTINHSQAVSQYAELICQEIGLSKKETECISIGALMHDIGKIGIPETVLSKPTRLDDDEWEIIKQHPTIGARRIIQPISALNDLIPVVEHHHERWDGRGYPYGLREEEIPLGARIVSIVDAFHTMTTDRPYRKALGYDSAVKILETGAGAQWDSSLIHTFLEISKKAYDIVQNTAK